MANRERGELGLVAGDQTYTLRLTTNACCELEDRAGKNYDEVVQNALRGSIRDIRMLLWGCLQDRHGDVVLTLDDAGRLIDDAGGIRGVIEQLQRFVTLNADDSKVERSTGGAAADPPHAQAGADGANSISAPAHSA